MRSVYLSNAVLKRVLKVDSGENIFEADNTVKWEGGWTLWVEARRKGRGESQACPRGSLAHTLWPSGARVWAEHLFSEVFLPCTASGNSS